MRKQEKKCKEIVAVVAELQITFVIFALVIKWQKCHQGASVFAINTIPFSDVILLKGLHV